MRIYNPQGSNILHPELQQRLEYIRAGRAFDATAYLEEKCTLLNQYMDTHGLGGCVLGMSGGIDSAIVLGIIHRAKQMDASPIRTIMPLLMPVYHEGMTNQDMSAERGREVCTALGIGPVPVDLTASFEALKHEIDGATCVDGEAWAAGQLVSYQRTPALYYTTSLLSQSGVPAIVCGTTNLDEGGYLGYFGKASDGMVDIQLISDIHKSEVFQLAEALDLPESVRWVTPAGDMYDGRSDEEVFGAPYDFVELYLYWLRHQETLQWAVLDEAAEAQFTTLAERLETMHRYNGHKYLGSSPAVHLDLYPVEIPGGWAHEFC